MSRCAQLHPITTREDYCQRQYHKNTPTRKRESVQTKSIQDVFVQALVTAGSCSQHREQKRVLFCGARDTSSTRSYRRSRSKDIQSRSFSTQASPRRATLTSAEPERPRDNEEGEISKDEYKGLLDQYSDDEFKYRSIRSRDDAEATRLAERPAKSLKPAKKQHYSLAPRLFLTPEQEEGWAYKHRRVIPPPENEEHAKNLRALHKLLQGGLGTVPHKSLWQAWGRLLTPRAKYVPDSDMKKFFRHLSWVEFRSSREAMRRFFALIDECMDEGVRLNKGAWTSAMAYAGKWVRNVGSEEVKAAIETWMRMEQEGHRANHYTFHVLTDVAIRAGRFALVDTLFSEMKARKIPVNRHFRTTLIYYAGKRGDSNAVRQAFQELVDAGELVDTLVMNVVIQSLLRAGEPAAAESTFSRMKALHQEKFGALRPSDWRERRRLDQFLDKSGATLRQQKEQHQQSFFGAPFSIDDKREEIQRVTPIAPDADTYSIFIKYHARTTGDLHKIRKLLEESSGLGHHIYGGVYFNILRGFVHHGGYRHSAWNRTSLEELWREILAECIASPPRPPAMGSADDEHYAFDALGPIPVELTTQDPDTQTDENEAELMQETPEMMRSVYFTRTVAYDVLHAFYKCTGPRRVSQVWQEILARWTDASEDDKEQVQKLVDKMLVANGMYNVPR